MSMRTSLFGVFALLLARLAVSAQEGTTPLPPSFSKAQVEQGGVVYAKDCGLCHGMNLEGAAGVALSGNAFAKSWGDGKHETRDFFDVISQQMPKNAPGSLSEAENLAVVAFILSKNGFPTGSQE